MIRNEVEYKTSLRDLAERQDRIQLEAAKLAEQGLSHDEVRRAMQPLEMFAIQLKEEIDEYERLKRGEFEPHELQNFDDLGPLLIRLRIASGLTQKQLAERLAVDESQISRDESNEYYGVTTTRLKKIFEALGVDVRTEVTRRPEVVQNG